MWSGSFFKSLKSFSEAQKANLTFQILAEFRTGALFF